MWLAKAFKSFGAGPADWAFPVLRQFFEWYAFLYLSFSVTLVGVVNITAINCLTLPHIFGLYHFLLLLYFLTNP